VHHLGVAEPAYGVEGLGRPTGRRDGDHQRARPDGGKQIGGRQLGHRRHPPGTESRGRDLAGEVRGPHADQDDRGVDVTEHGPRVRGAELVGERPQARRLLLEVGDEQGRVHQVSSVRRRSDAAGT
jgi:hypothetical protein